MSASSVTWIPWSPEHSFLAAYKKDCSFCPSPAKSAACTKDDLGDSPYPFVAIIRCCDDRVCRALAVQLAIGLVLEGPAK